MPRGVYERKPKGDGLQAGPEAGKKTRKVKSEKPAWGGDFLPAIDAEQRLVLVTMGTEADKKLMRMPFAKDRELHRIWVPDDFRITEADLSWAVGLDVFVAPWTEPERMTQFMVLLWRARVATLWQLDAGFTATRLFPAGRYQELLAFTPARVKLDEGFRRRIHPVFAEHPDVPGKSYWKVMTGDGTSTCGS